VCVMCVSVCVCELVRPTRRSAIGKKVYSFYPYTQGRSLERSGGAHKETRAQTITPRGVVRKIRRGPYKTRAQTNTLRGIVRKILPEGSI
jgi:hypothetical protein